MPLSADFQARKNAILYKNKPVFLGICAHHGVPATLKDETGTLWCSSCQQRHDLLNWGCAHAWPAVYVHPYAIGNDAWLWRTAAQWGKMEAVVMLLEGLQRVPEGEEEIA